MMIRKRAALWWLTCFLWLLAPELQGQQRDFQSWWELELRKDLRGGFDIAGELEQRFRNNSLQYDRTLVTITGGYGVNRYLDLNMGVRGVAVMSRELQMQSKFRVHADATGSVMLGGIDLSLRTRFQYGFDDVLEVGYFRLNTLVNRNRLKAAFHLFGTRFDLFAYAETWHLLNDVPSRLTYKLRLSGGVEYALNFVSGLTLRYILEDEFNVRNPLQSHILIVGYGYRF